MAKYKQIYIDIFKRHMIVFIGNHEEFKSWANTYYSDNDEYEEFIKIINQSTGKAQASCYFNNGDGECVIEIPSEPINPNDISYAVHEILHATFNILDFVGVEYYQNGSNETFTYLIEYITKEVFTLNNYLNYDSSLS